MSTWHTHISLNHTFAVQNMGPCFPHGFHRNQQDRNTHDEIRMKPSFYMERADLRCVYVWGVEIRISGALSALGRDVAGRECRGLPTTPGMR